MHILDSNEWIFFWMNIPDFVLNWIIFRPDSMKKWILKTDRPGLSWRLPCSPPSWGLQTGTQIRFKIWIQLKSIHCSHFTCLDDLPCQLGSDQNISGNLFPWKKLDWHAYVYIDIFALLHTKKFELCRGLLKFKKRGTGALANFKVGFTTLSFFLTFSCAFWKRGHGVGLLLFHRCSCWRNQQLSSALAIVEPE